MFNKILDAITNAHENDLDVVFVLAFISLVFLVVIVL